MSMPDLITLHNGEKVQGTFSRQEMDNRITRLRNYLAENRIDSALFTSYHNINYYSNFLYCAFGRCYGLVITDHDHATISANIDGGQPWRRSVENNITYTDWQKDNYFTAVKKLIKDSTTVGVEYDHVNLHCMNKLKSMLPECKFVDIGEPAMYMRMIKSEQEIAHITKMAGIADIGGAACVEAISVGVPEYEVALHSTQAMVREIADRYPHAELLDTWTWFQSGLNTDGAHNPVTSRRIEQGDILSLNCFPMVAGYYVALERTLFAEECSDEHLKLWRINCDVHKEGSKLIKPGVRCCDIAHSLNQIYQEYGLLANRTFGYGHSFGVLCHYYGREAGLELREDVDTVLQPNMVVSMEPMIMIPEHQSGAGGYREHDILVVTEQGNTNITGFPYGPEHNIIRN